MRQQIKSHRGSRTTRIAVLAAMALSAEAPSAHAKAAEPLAGHVLSGVVENGQAGFDLAAVGDLDGDRVDDFVVGAPFGDAGKGAPAAPRICSTDRWTWRDRV